jgi:hypothetical protein
MSDWSFFDYDPETRTKILCRTLDDGRMAFRISQDVDLIIEANAEAEKATMNRRFGEWNHMAAVPLRLIEKTGLDIAVSMQDKKFISKFMNDSDLSKFRTSRGKV